MPLIDTHCHLEYDYSPKTTDDLISEAMAAGVSHLITIGTEFKTFETIQKISEKHERVFHTIGIHPHEAISIQNSNLDLIENLSKHPKCVAIGEIGLDFHYDHSPREIQIQRLHDQIKIAQKRKLPVVIHAREAEDELIEIFTHYFKNNSTHPGVIHCFSGTSNFGKKCLDLGFLISFSGILTFKKSEELRQFAQTVPMDRLLIETDAPYLAPVPYRGKKCEPLMVTNTAQLLAEIKNVSLEEIAASTTRNAKKIFSIS